MRKAVLRALDRLALIGLPGLALYGFLAADSGLAGKTVVVGTFVLSLLRPQDGLLVSAALFVLAGCLLGVLHTVPAVGEAGVLAFLAGWLLRDLFAGRAEGPSNRTPGKTASSAAPPLPIDPAARTVILPALAMAGVVAAACLVPLLERAFIDYPSASVRELVAFLTHEYVISGSVGTFIVGGPMLMGIGLLVATVQLGRRHPSLPRRAAAVATVTAAVVAWVNVWKFVALCLRNPSPLQAFAANVRGIRISAVFPDYNAAGSYLAMMLLVAIGFALSSRRARWLWAAASALIAASLWFTGSRAALLAVPVGIVFLVAVLAHARNGRTWWKSAVVVVVAFALAVVAVGQFFPPDAGQRPPMGRVEGRIEMARVSLKMFASAPVFGVGLGRFLGLSRDYMADWLKEGILFENATNNFLQILAELGIVGLVPFLWLLGVVARRSWSMLARRRPATAVVASGARIEADSAMAPGGMALRSGMALESGLNAGSGMAPIPDPVAANFTVVAATAAGILTFLVTCFAGHPLLVREVCVAFWLVLGVLAAFTLQGERSRSATPRGHASPTWRRLVPALLVIGLAVSVPLRAHRVVGQEANLDNVGAGFSRFWEWDSEGVRYRTMTDRAKFYVAGETCRVGVLLRVDPQSAPESVDVEITVDGHAANRVRAVRNSWREVPILVSADSNVRFRTIELTTRSGHDVVVRVGKPRLHVCPAPAGSGK